VTTPPSRPPRSWNGEKEVLEVVPLLRAEGGEEESQFGLVASEEGCGDHFPLTTAAILEWRRKSVYILFIGALKGGFVIERSELGSCRAFRVQYPIFIGIKYAVPLCHARLQ